MVQSSNDAATKDVPIKFRMVESVSDMVQRNICAVIMDVQTKPRRKGYV